MTGTPNYPSMAAGLSPAGMTDSVYQALLANRIIFLGSEVRDENANAICADSEQTPDVLRFVSGVG